MNVTKHQEEAAPTDAGRLEFVGHVAQIATAYVAHNRIMPSELPQLLTTIASGLGGIASVAEPPAPQKPAIPIKQSVTDEYIVCLEDGKRLTMMKRYLKRKYNLTPAAYRKKWGLPPDYPMVAPAYAKLRSAFAKKIGLGTVAVSGPRKKGK